LPDGRVALLGDAAFCPSPVGGDGSSLALIGAYVRPRSCLPPTISTPRWPDTSSSCGRTSPLRNTSGPRCSDEPTLAPRQESAHCIPVPALSQARLSAPMSVIGSRFGSIAAEDIKLPDYSPSPV
jgi:hypothetical protein